MRDMEDLDLILGTGVDLIEVARIKAALDNPRTGQRFRQRVFTAGEISYCDGRRTGHESFAARFAAKEAVFKALGRLYGWREVEVRRAKGPPTIELHGRAAERAREIGVQRLHLSLTHTAANAVAFVVLEN
jgi:holo-[acyl-carrier protein] synthase